MTSLSSHPSSHGRLLLFCWVVFVSQIFAGDTDGDGDFDFDHCIEDFSSPSSSQCGLVQLAQVPAALLTFSSCTGWEPLEITADIADASALEGLEDLVAECGDTEAWQEDSDGVGFSTCLNKITNFADDQSNPFSPYISDIYNDPDKYCDCNKDLQTSLPSCSLSYQGQNLDTNNLKMATCLMHELCDEFDLTCRAIGTHVVSCIQRAMSSSGIVESCAEQCTNLAQPIIPAGCVDSAVDTNPTLWSDISTYNAACPDSDSSPPTPTSAPSPTPPSSTEEVKVVSIKFHSSVVIKVTPPPYDDSSSLLTYVKVLEKAIAKNLGAAHASVKVTKLGTTPIDSRRLIEAPEDLNVEFTVNDDVDCASDDDCSNVGVDDEVDRVYANLKSSIEDGALVDSIKEVASEESVSSTFNEASVESSTLTEPERTTSEEITVTRASSDGDDEGGSDGGIDIPIDIDFQHCLSDPDETPPDCSIMQGIAALTTVTEFTECTDWDATELVTAVLGGAEIFGDIVAACAPEGGTPDASDVGCVDAISKIATDSDNPLAPFIGDLITNPQKYCSCNADFSTNLPSCVASGVDIMQMKELSCVFSELCSELGQTCNLIVQGVETCLDNSGLANSGTTNVDCSLNCLAVSIPDTCLKDEGDEDADGNVNEDSELEQKLESYKESCGDGGDGGGDDDGGADFGQCSEIYEDFEDGTTPPNCNFDAQLSSAILKFGQCTKWDLVQLIRNFSSGDISAFTGIITDCADLTQEGMAKCFSALAEVSEDTENPISEYIGDIYNKPDKYCSCNKRLYGSLPDPCMFTPPGQEALDLGQAKLTSCMIRELCDELDEACDTLGEQLDDECLPAKEDITESSCAGIKTCIAQWEGIEPEDLAAYGLPNGCLGRFDRGLKERSLAFEYVCLGIDRDDKDGPGQGGDKDDKDDYDDGNGKEADQEVSQTSGAFPPEVGYAAGAIMFAGIGFVIFRKVMKKPKHPQMMRIDSRHEGGDDGITMNALQKQNGGGGGRGTAVVQASYDDGDEFANLRSNDFSNGNTDVMDFANFGDGQNGNGAHQPHVNENGLLDLRPDHVANHDLPTTQQGAKSDDVVIGI
mmetsp:Transcript_798/g.1696  ORF Transcript_798/g.1696 Transcript_798/m.1696 type:complete len:1094 (-) Transcript_798:33-3314(-)